MSETLLECMGLTCGYAGKAVLSEIDIKVEPGETIALLGPNGSGKSTLLKAICGSLPILSGEVYLGNANLTRIRSAAVARRVAFVPQDEEFRFEFTVRDVVTMGRLPLSESLWDTPEDVAAATEAMRSADCLHLQARSAMELSGGEKQRVLIARALAQGASLMLLDEPTSHLDVEHQLTVAALVRRLADQGRSTIAAIHDLNLAPLVADRAILLQDGKIGMDAPTQEVLESKLLDDVYRVSFERTKMENGRLVVLPLRKSLA